PPAPAAAPERCADATAHVEAAAYCEAALATAAADALREQTVCIVAFGHDRVRGAYCDCVTVARLAAVAADAQAGARPERDGSCDAAAAGAAATAGALRNQAVRAIAAGG